MYDSQNNYYFYIGGAVKYGETILEAAQREVKEECGDDVHFTFGKIVYVRDFIAPQLNEHSVELFIYGNINRFYGLEKRMDSEFGNTKWLSWVDLTKLPKNLYPMSLTDKLIKDINRNFPFFAKYLGKMK